MTTKARNSPARRMQVEGLESRQMLNSHLPGPSTVVPAESAGPPPVIRGSLGGTTSYVQDVSNAHLGIDTYLATGSDTLGAVTLTGLDTYFERQTHKNIYLDTYANGSLSLEGDDGTFEVSYVGKGSQVGNGKFTSNLVGTAVGTSGLVDGEYASFVATATGNSTTSDFNFKYVLKLLAPPKVVTGSVAFSNSYTTDPINPNAGTDSYSSLPNASLSAFAITGQDAYTEVSLGGNNYRDTYPAGSMTLSNNLGLFEVTYTGKGKSFANGKYVATFVGTAIGTSGLFDGATGVFTAISQGNDNTSLGKLTFKIKT